MFFSLLGKSLKEQHFSNVYLGLPRSMAPCAVRDTEGMLRFKYDEVSSPPNILGIARGGAGNAENSVKDLLGMAPVGTTYECFALPRYVIKKLCYRLIVADEEPAWSCI